LTVTVVDCDAVPPGPVHVSLYMVETVSPGVDTVPPFKDL
jgi:hypothetical protein